MDGLRTEACGQQKQSNDPRNNQHNPQYANYWAPLTRKRHILPHSAQPWHTNHWAPRTRKRHPREHRPQRPTEHSDPTQHAERRTGDCPGPRNKTATRQNVTQGGGGDLDPPAPNQKRFPVARGTGRGLWGNPKPDRRGATQVDTDEWAQAQSSTGVSVALGVSCGHRRDGMRSRQTIGSHTGLRFVEYPPQPPVAGHRPGHTEGVVWSGVHWCLWRKWPFGTRGAACSNSRPKPPPPLPPDPPKVFEPVFLQFEILEERVGAKGTEIFFCPS